MIEQIGAALRGRAVSSIALVREALRRAEVNADLNAFITLMPERAIAQAEQLDDELSRGEVRGPLHGVPVAIKDLVCTKGVRTTGGSRLYADYLPDHDAEVLTRLEAAGAVVFGKTGLHELAYGITSNNPHFGAVRNPWDIERIPGGSSGGSGAAVAAGICPMALGTDTGGSIRIPASFCGVIGFKPTYGVVSKRGVLPLGFSLDHIGPLAATVRDAAVTMSAIAGHDPHDPASSNRVPPDFTIPRDSSLEGVRIGRPDRFYFERLQDGVRDVLESVFRKAESMGARIARVEVPDIDDFNAVALAILLGEAAAVHESNLDRRDEIGPDVRLLLDQGRMLPASSYVNAQRLRSRFSREFAKVWDSCDVLFLPATPTVAPRIGQATVTLGSGDEDVRLLTTRCVRAINALGWPALSLPCGLADGLPVGLQIVGPAFRDDAVLRAGAALEDALPSVICPRFTSYI